MQTNEITSKHNFPTYMFSVINEEIQLESNPSVLILIPSKNRNDLLLQCINSIILQTSSKLTNITLCVIDTGSDAKCIKEINTYIKANNSNITLKLVKHNYYNFARNNNQAFKEMNGSEFDFVVFCNNDIKLLNDSISNMINVYETTDHVGTVGIRLHFGNGTVQHLGAFCKIDKDNKIRPGHYAFKKIITGSVLSDVVPIDLNTAAFMMTKAEYFAGILFNESYNECYEDVELNLAIPIKYEVNNYCCMKSCAFHYESQSRNEDANKLTRQHQCTSILQRFIDNNKNTKYIQKNVLYYPQQN